MLAQLRNKFRALLDRAIKAELQQQPLLGC